MFDNQLPLNKIWVVFLLFTNGSCRPVTRINYRVRW